MYLVRFVHTLPSLLLVPPVIKSASRQTVVSVGERVELPCIVTGSPQPSISWTKDRRRIDMRDARFIQQPDGNFVIRQIEVWRVSLDTIKYIISVSLVVQLVFILVFVYIVLLVIPEISVVLYFFYISTKFIDIFAIINK